MLSPKKKKNPSLNKKNRNLIPDLDKVTYDDTRDKIASLINDIAQLYMQSKKNKDKIALWGLAYAHEDLVKLYHRLGNLKYTTKRAR